MTPPAETVLQTLSTSGVLLVQDKQLPSVVTLVTGESVRGSWWSHPKGRLVFAVLNELADRPDVLFTKLLQQKVTLVHRRLWPAFLTVATSGESWQLDRLSAAAREMVDSVNGSPEPVRGRGAVVKELEGRLLVHAEQVHTESGRHEVVLESWSRWARKAKVKRLRAPAAARRQLEEAAIAIGATIAALPWQRATGNRQRKGDER